MIKSNEPAIPGGLYLCQVCSGMSCGACCGLYNVENQSRESLLELLNFRTQRFARTLRDVDSIEAFKKETEQTESQNRPFPEFHHCPYLGLTADMRVGCLLHPMAEGNGGIDYRGLSYYGTMACREYFCPSYQLLPPVTKTLILSVTDDWYLYGLIVTEALLVNTIFSEVERRIRRSLSVEDVLGNAACLETVRKFFMLKLNWPFRNPSSPNLCHYFFRDNLYQKPPVDYDAAGAKRSCYDVIFRELGSMFNSSEEVHLAEMTLDRLLEHFAEAL